MTLILTLFRQNIVWFNRPYISYWL